MSPLNSLCLLTSAFAWVVRASARPTAMSGIDLLNWQSNPLLQTAASTLGLVEDDLRFKPRESFEAKGVPSEIVKLRFEHAEDRRRQSAEALSNEYDKLVRRQQEQALHEVHHAGASSSVAGSSRTPINPKLAGDQRRLEMLAKRRDEEIEKMLAFQLSQRETEQKNAEAAVAEARAAERKAKEAALRQRAKMEAKRKHAEEELAKERALEAAAQAKRNADLARERDRMRQEAIKALQAKRESRAREEENKAKQARRQQETKELFEAHEARVRERGRLAELRKEEKRKLFEAQQREARLIVQERQEKARGRVEAAREAQERMAEEQRQAFEERERQMQVRKEREEREQAEMRRQQRERQLAMALRRGMIFEKMRSDEEQRVNDLVNKMSQQEEAMAAMQKERRVLQWVRDERRRLREKDRQENIERMMRAKEYHNMEMKGKFADEDAREAVRRANKVSWGMGTGDNGPGDWDLLGDDRRCGSAKW